MMTDEKKKSENEEVTPPLVSDERRDFLKKCGKYGAYTAPAIAALLLFDKKKAHAGS